MFVFVMRVKLPAEQEEHAIGRPDINVQYISPSRVQYYWG